MGDLATPCTDPFFSAPRLKGLGIFRDAICLCKKVFTTAKKLKFQPPEIFFTPPKNPFKTYSLPYVQTVFNNRHLNILPAECIYVSHLISSVNTDYFLKQRYPVDLCNSEVLCFLCGTD
jgi:hypothetical protein